MKKIGRFLDEKSHPHLGVFVDDYVRPARGDLFGELVAYGEPKRLADIRILPPVRPSKIIGIGSNYRRHIQEMGRPTPTVPKIFLKPNSSVIGHKDAIQIPPQTTRVDHEVELAIVIGRWAERVSEQDAMQYVLGLSCLNDVTARDFQRQDGVFARGKGFDTFCPLGPWILTSHECSNRWLRCWVDDELRQDGSTDDLLFSVPRLLSFVSHVMTLYPGDVIATGTPMGVGPIKAGQRVSIEIEGIGRLENPVINREDRHVD